MKNSIKHKEFENRSIKLLLEKIFIGSLVIVMVAFFSYILLFALMILI